MIASSFASALRLKVSLFLVALPHAMRADIVLERPKNPRQSRSLQVIKNAGLCLRGWRTYVEQAITRAKSETQQS